jgi:hypothetical protein
VPAPPAAPSSPPRRRGNRASGRICSSYYSRREHDQKCLVKPFFDRGIQQLRQLHPHSLTKFITGIKFCSPYQQVSDWCNVE